MELEQYGYSTNLKSRVSFQSLRRDKTYAFVSSRIFIADEMGVSLVHVNTALSARGKEEDKQTSKERSCNVAFIFFVNTTGKFILSFSLFSDSKI
jgi:hypothetical protein